MLGDLHASFARGWSRGLPGYDHPPRVLSPVDGYPHRARISGQAAMNWTEHMKSVSLPECRPELPRAQAAAGQDALDKKVHMLEAHQAEIHASLASMEGEAARLYQARPPHSSI